MFCGLLADDHRGGTWMTYFFQTVRSVKMCMDDRRPFPILEVVVEEGTDTPDSYWGWWDSERQAFNIVFARKLLVEICFPYGSKAEEDRGRGKLLPVNVRVIREVL